MVLTFEMKQQLDTTELLTSDEDEKASKSEEIILDEYGLSRKVSSGELKEVWEQVGILEAGS